MTLNANAHMPLKNILLFEKASFIEKQPISTTQTRAENLFCEHKGFKKNLIYLFQKKCSNTSKSYPYYGALRYI